MTVWSPSRDEFEATALALGSRPVKDARCHGEYWAFQQTGRPYSDTEYDWLMIRRGAALAAEGCTPADPGAVQATLPARPATCSAGPTPIAPTTATTVASRSARTASAAKSAAELEHRPCPP